MSQIGNTLDAFKFLNENDVDVIFLDVEMPKMGGMELLRNLQIKPLVVMSYHDEFALESYEYDVTDFLKKPLDTPRFLKTIEKIKKTLVGEPAEKNDDYIFIKSDSKLVQIKLEDIHWIEALGNYMRLHTDKEKHGA